MKGLVFLVRVMMRKRLLVRYLLEWNLDDHLALVDLILPMVENAWVTEI